MKLAHAFYLIFNKNSNAFLYHFRVLIATVFIIIIADRLYAQKQNQWTAFWDESNELVGFKDENGNVVIEPKFSGFIVAFRFDDIIACTEDNDTVFKMYYLTKKGKIVGLDSLWISDNTPDCESEGFIRFRVKKTDKVGMFNSTGVVVIPANYNELSKVTNGLIVALKNGKKKYWGNGDEHYYYKGGTTSLIDTANHIIIKKFQTDENLNFFSLKQESELAGDPVRKYFIGTDNKYYSLIDYEKEFSSWLNSELLNAFTKENLIRSSFEIISFWDEENGWISESKENFVERNFELIKTKMLEIQNSGTDYFISNETLNPFTYDQDQFKDYFNNCGDVKDQYPVFDIVINHNINNDLSQDHFEFLRTDDGYKLISLSITE